MQRQAWALLASMTLGSGSVLTVGTPHFGELARGLSAPQEWVALVGPDAAVATLAGALLWLVALWVALCLVLTAGSLLPGRLGGLARATAQRLTPAALRRVVGVAAGASVLLTPVSALAAPAGSPSPSAAPSAMPAVGWPTDPRPGLPAESPSATRAAPSAPGPDASPRPTTGQVTVRPGDSLWSIAARRLGSSPSTARIQQEWPRWYATNRQLIGTDPNLLLPGTRLLAPRPASTDTGA